MIFPEIESNIRVIANNTLLYDEKNFNARTDAIDFLEFHSLDQIEALRNTEPDHYRLAELYRHAEKIKTQLENIDNQLFSRLRQEIKQKKYRDKRFAALVKEYVNFENNKPLEEEGYDNLDIFINRLLSLQNIPEQSRPLEPEMVFYQKTPA